MCLAEKGAKEKQAGGITKIKGKKEELEGIRRNKKKSGRNEKKQKELAQIIINRAAAAPIAGSCSSGTRSGCQNWPLKLDMIAAGHLSNEAAGAGDFAHGAPMAAPIARSCSSGTRSGCQNRPLKPAMIAAGYLSNEAAGAGDFVHGAPMAAPIARSCSQARAHYGKHK